MQDEVCEYLIPVLADEGDERLRRQLVAQLVRCQAILGKREVELVENYIRGKSSLN